MSRTPQHMLNKLWRRKPVLWCQEPPKDLKYKLHQITSPQDQADPLVLEIRTPNLGSRMVSYHKHQAFWHPWTRSRINPQVSRLWGSKMVFLQTIKSLKSIFYFDIFWVFVSGNFLSKFCTSNKYYSCFSHTHTLRSSDHRNVLGFSAFCSSVFLSCIRPSTSVKKMRRLFLQPWLGYRCKTWSLPWLGLCVSDMDYDGSGSTLAKTQTKQIGNQKWVIPGHQSAPGVASFFPSCLVAQNFGT